MKSLLYSGNPLYGRIDFEINLKELSYYKAQNFYPIFSLEDKVRLYSLFEGIPYYNQLIDVNKSIKENIIDLITSPGARLHNEIPMYLSSEISKIANVNEVFLALAKGFNLLKIYFHNLT